ncbi:hypothetical protein Q9966_014900 [Columba livia]|nr:hypothetical protein Q9966_014900 [Columba livia]
MRIPGPGGTGSPMRGPPPPWGRSWASPTAKRLHPRPPPPRTPRRVATRSRISQNWGGHWTPPRRKKRMRMKPGGDQRGGPDFGDPPGNSLSPISLLKGGGHPDVGGAPPNPA